MLLSHSFIQKKKQNFFLLLLLLLLLFSFVAQWCNQGDMKMFKEAYPTYECLGWYTTGVQIDPTVDTLIHAMVRPLLRSICDGQRVCVCSCNFVPHHLPLATMNAHVYFFTTLRIAISGLQIQRASFVHVAGSQCE